LPDLQIWDDDLDMRNQIHCNYLMGLGHLGLGNLTKAKGFFNQVLTKDTHHTVSNIHVDRV